MICGDFIADKLIKMKLSNAQDDKVDMASHHQSYLPERSLRPALDSLLTLNSLLARDHHMNHVDLIHKLSTLCDPSVTSSVQLADRRSLKRAKQPLNPQRKAHCLPPDLPAYRSIDPSAVPSSTVALKTALMASVQLPPFSLPPTQPPLPERSTSSASPEADRPAASETPTTTKSSHAKKKYPCDLCDKSFDYKHVLQNHNRTHTGEKPYECPQCQKRFTRDHHLKTHIRLHTGEKPFTCGVCGKCFVQVANLRRHERVHTGERPFQCGQCTARFSDSNQLKAHELVHTDIMPYSCEICGYRYRRKHHGKSHKCGRPARRRQRQLVAAATSGADNSASSLSGTPSPSYSAPSPASGSPSLASGSPSPASGSSNGSSLSSSLAANNNNNNNEEHTGMSSFRSPSAGSGDGVGKMEDDFYANNNGYHFLRRPYAYWSQFPAQFTSGPQQEQPEDLSIKK